MAMRNLYIVGAGGFGREVYCWLQDAFPSERDWQFCGFLDDAPTALDGMNYEKGVVAPISGFIPQHSDIFVCGLGSVPAKMKLCQPLIDRGALLLTLIHPSAPPQCCHQLHVRLQRNSPEEPPGDPVQEKKEKKEKGGGDDSKEQKEKKQQQKDADLMKLMPPQPDDMGTASLQSKPNDGKAVTAADSDSGESDGCGMRRRWLVRFVRFVLFVLTTTKRF